MNRMQLFKEMYEISNHNLLCYSENYHMKKPKVGYIKEWRREQEKVKLIKDLIIEEKQRRKEKNES